MSEDVASIAARPTKAQREAVIFARPTFNCAADRVFAAGITKKALRERGIGHGDWCFLTVFGLKVRDHLLSKVQP